MSGDKNTQVIRLDRENIKYNKIKPLLYLISVSIRLINKLRTNILNSTEYLNFRFKHLNEY